MLYDCTCSFPRKENESLLCVSMYVRRQMKSLVSHIEHMKKNYILAEKLEDMFRLLSFMFKDLVSVFGLHSGR